MTGATMKWDYVFVGAGPATLVAATLLSKDSGCRILALEAGGEVTKRGCPGLRQRTCISCSGEDCRVTMGVGGSSAGFGNKLCEFPASPAVLSLIPGHLLPDVRQIVTNVTGASGAAPDISTISSLVASRKFYDAHAIFRKEYRGLLQKLILALPDNVRVRSGASVSEVLRTGRDFEIRLSSGERVQARNLVLATGRSGHRFMRAALSSLGVAFFENSADIGIRVEADDAQFSDAFFYQGDPKFKFNHGELGSSRTFCSCRGGSIVPVKFGNGFFADGAFVNSPTGVTNVALMVRSNELLSTETIDTWLNAVNSKARRSLLLGEIIAPTAASAAASILEAIPLWPSEAHKLLMKELLESVVAGRHIHMFSSKSAGQKIRVYGPCVDLYWPTPVLSQGFRTEVEGLSIIGDATGLSRGILQALASGAGWALLEVGRAEVYDYQHTKQTDSPAAA